MRKNSEPKIKHKSFKPEKGTLYTNRNGFRYRCLEVSEDTAVFEGLGGWTLTAHHCVMYENGTIGWQYSTEGHFKRGVLP